MTGQGLQEAAEDVLRMLDAKASDEHLIPSAVGWMRDKLRAALERPRPAPPEPLEVLPQDDPTLVDVIAGLAVACGEARVREEYRLAAGGERRYTPLPEETKLFDMLDRAHLAEGGSAGTGAAPPESLDVDRIKRRLAVYAVSIDGFDSLPEATQELLTDCAEWIQREFGGGAQPPPSAPRLDVEQLNRAVDTMMEQAQNLRDVLSGVPREENEP